MYVRYKYSIYARICTHRHTYNIRIYGVCVCLHTHLLYNTGLHSCISMCQIVRSVVPWRCLLHDLHIWQCPLSWPLALKADAWTTVLLISVRKTEVPPWLLWSAYLRNRVAAWADWSGSFETLSSALCFCTKGLFQSLTRRPSGCGNVGMYRVHCILKSYKEFWEHASLKSLMWCGERAKESDRQSTEMADFVFLFFLGRSHS